MADKTPGYLTRAQAARELGLTKSGVRVAQDRGELVGELVDGVHVFRFDHVRAVARKRRRKRAGTQGKLAARVFALFAEGASLVDVVRRLRVTPERVRKLWAQYRTPLGAPAPRPGPSPIDRAFARIERETFRR